MDAGTRRQDESSAQYARVCFRGLRLEAVRRGRPNVPRHAIQRIHSPDPLGSEIGDDGLAQGFLSTVEAMVLIPSPPDPLTKRTRPLRRVDCNKNDAFHHSFDTRCERYQCTHAQAHNKLMKQVLTVLGFHGYLFYLLHPSTWIPLLPIL